MNTLSTYNCFWIKFSNCVTPLSKFEEMILSMQFISPNENFKGFKGLMGWGWYPGKGIISAKYSILPRSEMTAYNIKYHLWR